MNKNYVFTVELTNGKITHCAATSKHINGAIRKIYQTYDVERIICIL